MSTKEESKEPDYNEDEDRDQFEEEQEEDSSKNLVAATALYLNAGFVDIPRYNDNYRADVFMERRLR